VKFNEKNIWNLPFNPASSRTQGRQAQARVSGIWQRNVSCKGGKSHNAELRRGGSLVGRMSRKVTQLNLKDD
jgi:hypothetical protein